MYISLFLNINVSSGIYMYACFPDYYIVVIPGLVAEVSRPKGKHWEPRKSYFAEADAQSCDTAHRIYGSLISDLMYVGVVQNFRLNGSHKLEVWFCHSLHL